MDANHALIVKKFKEEVNGLIREILERQPTKKKLNVLNNVILIFFVVKVLFKRDDEQQKDFFARPLPSNYGTSIVIAIVNFFWFNCLFLHLYHWVKAHYGGAKNVVTLYSFLKVSMFELQPS